MQSSLALEWQFFLCSRTKQSLPGRTWQFSIITGSCMVPYLQLSRWTSEFAPKGSTETFDLPGGKKKSDTAQGRTYPAKRRFQPDHAFRGWLHIISIGSERSQRPSQRYIMERPDKRKKKNWNHIRLRTHTSRITGLMQSSCSGPPIAQGYIYSLYLQASACFGLHPGL